MRQAQRSRGFRLGFFVIYFLVVRAVIVAWVVTVELFLALGAVLALGAALAWGFRDYAVALWLFLLCLFPPSCLPD